MLKTIDLIETLESMFIADQYTQEIIQIIIHRLKYLDQLKEEVSNTYAGITSSELFERNDLSG